MLTLYHHNVSVCAQKVRLALAEKQIPHEKRRIDLVKGEQLSPEFLRINPKGLVPTIVHDGKPVAESTIILEFLEDAFPERPLRPADPHARARMRAWARVPDEGIHVACGTVSFACVFGRQVLAIHGRDAIDQRLAKMPDRARAARQRALFDQALDAPFVPDALKQYDKMLADMEKALSAGPWLAGDTFSLAECAVAPYVLRLDRLGLSALWAERPRLADWYARLCARPSWDEAITAHPSAGAGDYDDDLRRAGIDHWPKVRALLAA